MKTFVIALVFGMVSLSADGQTLIGKWQLMKQTNCIENELPASSEETEALVKDMKDMAAPSPQVIEFKEKNEGQESTMILTKKKAANHKAFLYKLDGSNLYILDKKSRIIAGTYTVESLTADSLIVSDAAMACETRVFARIK